MRPILTSRPEGTPMPDLTAVVDLHLAAYAEPDRARREALIADAWAPDGQLVDPPLTGSGHDGIADAADALLSQFPGHSFRRSSVVDEHHGELRYGWELVTPDGSVALSGLDVGSLAEDGRLARITGFFGGLTPAKA
jgi:hypothetical protein